MLDDDGWRDLAACRRSTPRWFYSADPVDQRYALELCGRCPVRGACLAEALEEEGSSGYRSFGIRGGLLSGQRDGLRRSSVGRRRRRLAS